MEAPKRSTKPAAPDFYTERGDKVHSSTVDRLFMALTNPHRNEELISVRLATDEPVPEELRGITFSLSRSVSRRRGDGCGVVPRGEVSLMNHRIIQDGPRPVTEAVASRVADYVEERVEEIESAHPMPDLSGRRKAFAEFLGSLSGVRT